MNLYAIISYMMQGKDAVAVFSSRDFAEKFLKSLKENNCLKIEQYSVLGAKPSASKTVFASHEYRAEDDIFYLKDFYWSYDDAKQNGGKHCLVKNLDIDLRKVAS